MGNQRKSILWKYSEKFKKWYNVIKVFYFGGAYMISFIIVLNVILAIICATFIFRKLVVQYKGSDNGFKNMVFIGFLIVALVCTLNGVWQGSATKGQMDYLKSVKEISSEKRVAIEKDIEFGKNSITTSTIVGFVSLFFSYGMFRNIQKEIKDNIGKPKKKWSWDEIENKNKDS